MAFAYKNLKTWQNTGSGIGDYVLIAPVSEFAADGIKCPTAPFTNPGDEVTVKENHVFLADKGFAKFLLAPEKNSLTGKTIGDLAFQKFDFELKIFIPGSYVEAHEQIKHLINAPLICLAPDADCDANFYYQLGCDCRYAYLKADFSTGTTKDGVKGYEATVTYQNGYVQIHKPTTGSPTILAD